MTAIINTNGLKLERYESIMLLLGHFTKEKANFECFNREINVPNY